MNAVHISWGLNCLQFFSPHITVESCWKTVLYESLRVLTPLAMFAALLVLLDYANICSLSWHGQKTKHIFWWHTFGHKPLICPQLWALTRFLVSFSVLINEDEPQDLCIRAAVIEWGFFDDECKVFSTQLWCEIYQIFTKIEPDILINDHVTNKKHLHLTLCFGVFFLFEWESWKAVDNSLNSIQTAIKEPLSNNWWSGLGTGAVWLGIMDSRQSWELCWHF